MSRECKLRRLSAFIAAIHNLDIIDDEMDQSLSCVIWYWFIRFGDEDEKE